MRTMLTVSKTTCVGTVLWTRLLATCDCAQAEVSNRVKDILRVYGIKDWQSEPHNITNIRTMPNVPIRKLRSSPTGFWTGQGRRRIHGYWWWNMWYIYWTVRLVVSLDGDWEPPLKPYQVKLPISATYYTFTSGNRVTSRAMGRKDKSFHLIPPKYLFTSVGTQSMWDHTLHIRCSTRLQDMSSIGQNLRRLLTKETRTEV